MSRPNGITKRTPKGVRFSFEFLLVVPACSRRGPRKPGAPGWPQPGNYPGFGVEWFLRLRIAGWENKNPGFPLRSCGNDDLKEAMGCLSHAQEATMRGGALDSRYERAGMTSLIRPTRNPLVWGLGTIFAPRPQGRRISPPRGVGSLSCEAGGQRGGAERAVHTHPIACIARSGQQYNPTRHPCACHPRAVRRKACYALVLVSCSCSERATCRSSLPIG